MKKLVGAPYPGDAVGVVVSGFAKLALRERVKASPPADGRITADKQQKCRSAMSSQVGGFRPLT